MLLNQGSKTTPPLGGWFTHPGVSRFWGVVFLRGWFSFDKVKGRPMIKYFLWLSLPPSHTTTTTTSIWYFLLERRGLLTFKNCRIWRYQFWIYNKVRYPEKFSAPAAGYYYNIPQFFRACGGLLQYTSTFWRMRWTIIMLPKFLAPAASYYKI